MPHARWAVDGCEIRHGRVSLAMFVLSVDGGASVVEDVGGGFTAEIALAELRSMMSEIRRYGSGCPDSLALESIDSINKMSSDQSMQ